MIDSQIYLALGQIRLQNYDFIFEICDKVCSKGEIYYLKAQSHRLHGLPCHLTVPEGQKLK